MTCYLKWFIMDYNPKWLETHNGVQPKMDYNPKWLITQQGWEMPCIPKWLALQIDSVIQNSL